LFQKAGVENDLPGLTQVCTAAAAVHLGNSEERFKGDGKLTFDRLTDVYHSGTRHK